MPVPSAAWTLSMNGNMDTDVTTARSATTEDLHPELRNDVDRLTKLNSVAAIVAGVLVIAVPGLWRLLLQLGNATDGGLRVLGVILVVVGLWFAVTARRPRTLDITTVNWLILWTLALLMLVGPFAFGLDVGWFGWLVLFALAVYFGTSATAWMFIHNRLAGRVMPRKFGQQPDVPRLTSAPGEQDQRNPA
jgi:uncharacterized protein YjeT (DUF2065 family)